jgi:DNA integrity scanning protein DisA with diadenylate cyclase activity
VVSEETGWISYAHKGEIFTKVSGDGLKKMLKEFLR